jgi:hypothetical protein
VIQPGEFSLQLLRRARLLAHLSRFYPAIVQILVSSFCSGKKGWLWPQLLQCLGQHMLDIFDLSLAGVFNQHPEDRSANLVWVDRNIIRSFLDVIQEILFVALLWGLPLRFSLRNRNPE